MVAEVQEPLALALVLQEYIWKSLSNNRQCQWECSNKSQSPCSFSIMASPLSRSTLQFSNPCRLLNPTWLWYRTTVGKCSNLWLFHGKGIQFSPLPLPRRQ